LVGWSISSSAFVFFFWFPLQNMTFSKSILVLRKAWVVVLLLLATMLLVTVNAALEGTCLNETTPLLQEPNLAVAQNIIFQDYNASYQDACSFGFTDLGCDITFEGDERTYSALCESKGGQLYKRPVVLSCAFGAVKYDLGHVPTCVGASCNITSVQPNDVITAQVQSFLDNLTFTGCAAEGAGADISSSASGLRVTFLAGVLVPLVFLWVGISSALLFGN
jgi:hypothetical protein